MEKKIDKLKKKTDKRKFTPLKYVYAEKKPNSLRFVEDDVMVEKEVRESKQSELVLLALLKTENERLKHNLRISQEMIDRLNEEKARFGDNLEKKRTEEAIKEEVKERLGKQGCLIETYGHDFWKYLGIGEVG